MASNDQQVSIIGLQIVPQRVWIKPFSLERPLLLRGLHILIIFASLLDGPSHGSQRMYASKFPRLGSVHSWGATQVRPVATSSRPEAPAAKASHWRSTSGDSNSQEGFETGSGRTSPSASRRADGTGKGSCWSVVGKCSQQSRPSTLSTLQQQVHKKS